MDPLNLFAILIWIIVLSKIIAHWIRVVDVLMYIVLGFLATKLWYIEWDWEILHFLAEVWVLFLMFYAWWHEDSKTFIKKVIENKWIAIIWAIWPFAWAYIWTKILWFSLNESVVAWFVFTATAVPYTIAILNSLKLDKTKASKSIIAAAMADDFLSIITMSAVFSTFVLVQSWWDVSIATVAMETTFKLFLLLVCFLVFAFLAMIVFPSDSKKKKHLNDLKGFKKIWRIFVDILWLKWFTKKFYEVEILVPTILFLMLFLSAFAHFMWLHPAIWAYLTGLILSPDMFHYAKKSYSTNWHDSLSWVLYSIANHFLWPIFFIYLGAQLVIDFSNAQQIFTYAFILFLFIASFQFISASLAARYTANLDTRDSVLVGFGMWPRDVLAFVILGVAISYWLVDKSWLFVTVIIVTVLFLDIATPLAIKWWSKEYENDENDENDEI